MSILALHGFTGCGADFAPLAERCGGDWKCPNLPGHGSDPQMDCSPDAMVDFIDMQHSRLNVQHTTPSTLLGYSMGARAALLHAIRNPNVWDALILISPNPGIEDKSERALRHEADSILAERIEHEGVEAFLDYWQNTPLIRSQQNAQATTREAMYVNRRQHKAGGLTNSLRQFGQGSFPNLWPDLKKLHLPTLLITGDADEKYTAIAQRMNCQLPKAIHQRINNSGHAPHLEKTEEFTQVLLCFLKAFDVI